MKALTNCVLVLTFFLMTACLRQELKPQDPIWGKQACENCRMVLSDKRFAVQRILSTGRILYYDDINCALKHNHGNDEGLLFVRPYGIETWVPAQEAQYMTGLMTPMNSGYGAVKEGGTINFSEIKKKFQGQ